MRDTPRILLVQGPNLHFLGRREPDKYGSMSAADLDTLLQAQAQATGFELSIFYTNTEGQALDRIYTALEADALDGLVMNPAAWSDAPSPSLRYCIMAVNRPYVEVHIRNQYQRSIVSSLADLAIGVIQGFGNPACYEMGLNAMYRHLKSG